MIKNIVFDMGGVLIDFNPARSLKNHFVPEYRELVNQNVFRSKEWALMDKGTYSVEDALKIMCSRLPDSLHSEVRKMVLDREAEMPPIDGMLPIVKKLKENGYRLYLLSNCPDWFTDFKKSVPAFTYFDGFIVSAFYNEVKPDEEIYKILFREFSLTPDECFFIDDTQANIETAKRLGMEAFCFADRDFEKLKASMQNNNINI